MYSVKSDYEITLMHLLTVAIFAHSIKIQRTLFFIAIANDRGITQKKQSPGPSPGDIKTTVFFVKTKKYKQHWFSIYRDANGRRHP